MTYQEALDYIQSVNWQTSKPGLERTTELLSRLGNPEKGLKFVHIAGTNGKGSTAACCAAILQRAGYRTGLYTSPYILRFNERMQIDGEQISDEELIELTEMIRPYADAMEDVPTEFEVITALAMEYFRRHACDIVVLEVGLGGELDATNVIEPPECAVITAIGLDHTAVLGNTLPEVASAKAGIIKEGCDVVTYRAEPEVEEVFEKACLEKHATLYKADFDRIRVHSYDLDAVRFDFVPYENIELPLVGTYQPKNAAVAITAVERLRARGWHITDEDIVEGLRHVFWPGRFEILMKEPTFVLDGAHNPHGMVATSESLRTYFSGKKLIFVMGVMADKDVRGMISLLAPMAKEFIAVEPHNHRAMEPAELRAIIESFGVPARTFPTVEGGVDAALKSAKADDVVVALGSLYFSADIRRAVLGD